MLLPGRWEGVLTYMSSGAFIRTALVVTVLAGAIGLQSQGRGAFTKRDKAFFADPKIINFVRPGLVFKVTSASVANDGTITAHVLVTDPQGLPLDRLGVNTPGTVSMSFIAATIPNGKTQYTSYTTRTVTAVSGGATAIQVRAEAGWFPTIFASLIGVLLWGSVVLRDTRVRALLINDSTRNG